METIGIVIFFKGESVVWECDAFEHIEPLHKTMNTTIRDCLIKGMTLDEIKELHIAVCEHYTEREADEFEELDFPILATALKVCIKLRAFQKDDDNQLAILVKNNKVLTFVATDKL